jgi:hypothetical protein
VIATSDPGHDPDKAREKRSFARALKRRGTGEWSVNDAAKQQRRARAKRARKARQVQRRR